MINKNSLFCILLLCACSTGKYITNENYQEVAIGENIANVQMIVGRPYEIKEVAPHKQEYIYIERMQISGARELFRRYIFTVEHGKVIHKKIHEETTPPIQIYG